MRARVRLALLVLATLASPAAAASDGCASSAANSSGNPIVCRMPGE